MVFIRAWDRVGAGVALVAVFLSACEATQSAQDDGDVETAVSALDNREAPGIVRDPGPGGEPAPPPNGDPEEEGDGPAVVTVDIPPRFVSGTGSSQPAPSDNITVITVDIVDPPLNPAAVPVPGRNDQLGDPGEGPPLTAGAVPVPTTPAPGLDDGPAGSDDSTPGNDPDQIQTQPGTVDVIGGTSLDGGSPP